jgi:histidinol dehydrogenase
MKGNDMKINVYHWHETPAKTRLKILRRSETDIGGMKDIVAPIIEDVRRNGDKALSRYARKFDGATIDAKHIKATEKEFADAAKRLDGKLKDSIRFCADNVRRFHQAQKDREEQRWLVEVSPGVWAGEQINPLPSVGLYVPRGKGAFPSVMYMLCTPAIVAGVPQIAVCTPPTPEGRVDDASLFTAEVCGIRNVYKVGGAQAIAALAYGTQTVPKVSKVIGPGNSYVAAARRLLADVINPGMPAGPSEALIVADDSAHVQNTARDLLNEAEHGPDSASILVTHSKKLAAAVEAILPGIINELPAKRREFCAKGFSTYGGIVITRSLEESIAFCNEYAVEHLHLKVRNPEQVVPKLHNVGEILVGEYTPIVMGNFGIGVNAVLPTGGHARTYSATSIWDYLKRTSLAMNTKAGFDHLKGPIVTVSDYEGFPAHSSAITKRETKGFDTPAPKALLAGK